MTRQSLQTIKKILGSVYRPRVAAALVAAVTLTPSCGSATVYGVTYKWHIEDDRWSLVNTKEASV